MNRPETEEKLAAVVAAVGKWPGSATFIQVAAALEAPAPMRNVQRWLSILVREKRVIRVGKTTATRFKLPPPVVIEPPLFGSPVAQAIHRLVTQPLTERMPADYRRVALMRYRPNETCYLSADLCARFVTSCDVSPWQEGPAFDRILAELVSRILSLECAVVSHASVRSKDGGVRRVGFGPAPRAAESGAFVPLSDAEIVGVLAEPERPVVCSDVRLLWNIRAVVVDLVKRGRDVKVTSGLLREVYQRVTNGVREVAVDWRGTGGPERRGAESAPYPSPAFLRAMPMALPETVYCPLGDGWVIEDCFEQVLRVSAAINNPVEHAFFLLAHLVYLLPFGMLNGVMAMLTMNVPLIASGLPPLTFSRVQPSDLMAGIRGLWELGRIELLREVFTA